MKKTFFITNIFEQRKTIETLLEESRANENFYVLLLFAAFITTLGILIDNLLVVVGGILVAPILVPILSLGMGVATSSIEAIRRSLKILTHSIIIVFGVSVVTTLIVGPPEVSEQLLLASSPDFIFFVIAFSSGAIAAFSWVKQNISATLPAVAIAVTLVPPLAATGISFAVRDPLLLTNAGLQFAMNFLGIVLASTIIFSIFGFWELQQVQDAQIREEKEEDSGENGQPPAAQ